MTEGEGGGGFLPPEPGGPAFGAGSSPPPPAAPAPDSPGSRASSIPDYDQLDWGAPVAAGDAGNMPANVSFALALGSAGLLLYTVGYSSIVSLGLGIAAVVYGQQARGRVERGETARHGRVAMAGFVLGIIVSLVSVVAIVLIAKHTLATLVGPVALP